MKRLTVLVMVLLLAMSSTALAIEPPLPYAGEFPFSQSPITLTCFNMAGSYTRGAFQDQKIWQYLKEKTNIAFEFESYQTEIPEKLALKMVSNDLPDVFYKVQLDNATVLKYAQEGVFVPLTPYLEEYAPNFYYQIQNDPSLKAFLTMEDGEIYGFNYIVSADNFMTPPVFVNGAWLKELGYDAVPEGLAAFKDLLIKVRDSDLNGNGQKDEIGYIATSLDALLQIFYGAFGIGTRGFSADTIDIDEAGNLRYIPTSEGYRKMLAYVGDLYREGLIYQEIFDSSITNMTAIGEQNRAFLGLGSLHYLGSTYTDQFVGMDTVFKGPDGYQFNAMVNNPILKQNTFITSANKYPAETVRLFDYFYSKEGIELYFMGFEGETFEYDENGLPRYNDYVQNNPDGLINEEVLGAYVPWGGGANPTIAENNCFGNNMYTEIEKANCAARMAYAPEVVWGEFNYTIDQYARLSVLENDIATYVNDMRAKFITGDANLETDWDSYVQTLNRMGLAELIEIYQSGLDTYTASNAK